MHDQQVDALAGGVAGDLDRMAAAVGVGDVQLDPAFQRVGEQITGGGVVDVALGLTISTARTSQEPICRRSTLVVVTVPSPASVRQAAVLVALEGAAGVLAAVVYVVSGLAAPTSPA